MNSCCVAIYTPTMSKTRLLQLRNLWRLLRGSGSKMNKFGVDVDLFKRELEALIKALDNCTPEELSGNLIRLLAITKEEITEGFKKRNVIGG
jgi:hypothetical protein